MKKNKNLIAIHNYLNPSRKHRVAVHLKEEKITENESHIKSSRVISFIWRVFFKKNDYKKLNPLL